MLQLTSYAVVLQDSNVRNTHIYTVCRSNLKCHLPYCVCACIHASVRACGRGCVCMWYLDIKCMHVTFIFTCTHLKFCACDFILSAKLDKTTWPHGYFCFVWTSLNVMFWHLNYFFIDITLTVFSSVIVLLYCSANVTVTRRWCSHTTHYCYMLPGINRSVVETFAVSHSVKWSENHIPLINVVRTSYYRILCYTVRGTLYHILSTVWLHYEIHY